MKRYQQHGNSIQTLIPEHFDANITVVANLVVYSVDYVSILYTLTIE